jgi:hypothetical protein
MDELQFASFYEDFKEYGEDLGGNGTYPVRRVFTHYDRDFRLFCFSYMGVGTLMKNWKQRRLIRKRFWSIILNMINMAIKSRYEETITTKYMRWKMKDSDFLPGVGNVILMQ